MAPYNHPSQVRHSVPGEDRHCPKSTQYNSTTEHVSSQSTYHSRIAQEVAYSHPHGTTATQYPQQIESNYSYTSETQYTAQPHSQPQQYNKANYHGTPDNPHFHQPAYAPTSNHAHTYSAHHIPPQEPHSSRTTALYAEKQRPTQSKLEILDYLAQPTSSMTRWEDENRKTRPWNGVGVVERGSVYEKRRE